MHEEVDRLRNKIFAAKGDLPADLVIRGGRLVNVFTATIEEGDVAVYDGTVVGVGQRYEGRKEVDIHGQWVIPGMIDGHIHIESSMLLPSRLAAALLPHGTTAIIADPHEIGNVLGVEGIRFMLEESAGIPVDIFFMAPSCIPATHLETAGAHLKSSDLDMLKNEPRILGLAEMMNYPGVLMGIPEVLEKLVSFKGKILDGHCPHLRGYDLQAYLTAGIGSDHEISDPDECAEKLKNGMMVMIREGTSAKNLERLLPLVNSRNARRFCFVSDDLHPHDILKKGHLDHILRKAVQQGTPPATAVQMATLNTAAYFGLRRRGAIAPGYQADLVVLSDLENVVVDKVYKKGQLWVDGGKGIKTFDFQLTEAPSGSMHFPTTTPEKFRIKVEGRKARVMELVPGQIITHMCYENVVAKGGWVIPDTERDILKLAVVERHIGSGRIGLGLVKGFGLKSGAMASSVAHDSHNVIAVGASDKDLSHAVETVRTMGGGMAVARDAKTLAKAPLEVAGIMSRAPLNQLTDQLDYVNKAAMDLGCHIPEPFMSLSFLSLPVIPELKLTDRGLVDVSRFDYVSLFVG